MCGGGALPPDRKSQTEMLMCLPSVCLSLMLATLAPAEESQGPRRDVQEFQPGLLLDWSNRSVEILAKVVLRKGSLELLACSSRSKEHESVLATIPRPLHIMQAMGLIGLEPGAPMRFDPATERTSVPTGEPLELRVRYLEGGLEFTVPAEFWLREVKTGKPPDPLPWVFSGSRNLSDGRFAADVDGTVAAVVDFDTSLISVGALHSADNDALWLEAHTEAIPPLGTECRLIVRGAGGRGKMLRVRLDEGGSFHLGEVRVMGDQLVQRWKGGEPGDIPPTLVVEANGVALDRIRKSLDELTAKGIPQRNIELRPAKGSDPPMQKIRE
jgi:hypothetical protein